VRGYFKQVFYALFECATLSSTGRVFVIIITMSKLETRCQKQDIFHLVVEGERREESKK